MSYFERHVKYEIRQLKYTRLSVWDSFSYYCSNLQFCCWEISCSEILRPSRVHKSTPPALLRDNVNFCAPSQTIYFKQHSVLSCSLQTGIKFLILLLKILLEFLISLCVLNTRPCYRNFCCFNCSCWTVKVIKIRITRMHFSSSFRCSSLLRLRAILPDAPNL